jgi:hypothetical protein
MRTALNENKTVQLVVLGVLLLVVGLFLTTRMLGGDEAAPPPPDATVGGLGSTDPSLVSPTGSTDVGGTAPTGLATSSGAVSAGGASVPVELLPKPPAEVLLAYGRGDTIALLVVRAGGIEDARVRSSARSLEGEPGVAVFVTRAKDIARYAFITQGVNVNRVPALVIVKPRRLSDGQPQATVTYGFRSTQSVVQAVRDAAYQGGKATYHPG